jgi:hypothetical protein
MGASVTFNATAQGDPPLHFQWRLDGTDLPGATSTTLALTAVAAGDFGGYSIIASNAHGTAASPLALLDPLHAPELLQPALTVPGASTNQFQFEFATQPGVSYVVEFVDALGLDWQFLRFVAGDGNSFTVTHLGAAVPARYYRIRVP